MSLETHIQALTVAIAALTAQLQGSSAPAVPQPAPQPSGYPPAGSPSLQYQPIAPQPPVAQATIPVQPAMPAPPVFQAPIQQVTPPATYPFHDNVTAATWAKDVWGKAAAINQEAAMQKFSALMQGMGAVDFDSLTPDKFPVLFAGIQQIKAEMGIPG